MAGGHKLDINMTLVYLIGLFGSLLIYMTVILTQTYYYHVEQAALNERVLTKKNFELQQYKTEQQQTLHSYGWVNKEEKLIRIPIEEAVAVTAQEMQKGTYPNYEELLADSTTSATREE